ncbi:hypothetical protein CSAL01_02335 [Colletotrichum salicis]|uniref:Uncharacterized protein n=1 Tax=Colletotrichum salicis TaxID=1209931 RepID=A0A135UL78_9PEZI|nr:hypothetical protein CSAL01_02335 [Colletotrichum salicis]
MPSSSVSTSRVAHPFITTVSPGCPPEFNLPGLRPPTLEPLQQPCCSTSLTTEPPRVALPRKRTLRTPAWLVVVGQPSPETKTSQANHCFWHVRIITSLTPLSQEHSSARAVLQTNINGGTGTEYRSWEPAACREAQAIDVTVAQEISNLIRPQATPPCVESHR